MSEQYESIPPQAEWDHDILSEQAERDWQAFQRDLEAEWRL